MSSTNVLLRLRNLLPQPGVLLVTVVSVDTAKGLSTVRFPGVTASTAYPANLSTGALASVRGTSVPAGKKAFIRAGAIEAQAPDGVILDVPLGRVVPVVSAASAVALAAIFQRQDASDTLIATCTAGSAPAMPVRQVEFAVPDVPDSLVATATHPVAGTGESWDAPAVDLRYWTLSNNGQTVHAEGGDRYGTVATPKSAAKWTGKRYFEVLLGGDVINSRTNTPSVGIVQQDRSIGVYNRIGSDAASWAFTSYGDLRANASQPITGMGGHSAGDVLMFAVDIDAGLLYLGRNGAWLAGGDPAAGTGGYDLSISSGYKPTGYRPAMCSDYSAQDCTLRTVAADYQYAPPSGFVQWANTPLPALNAQASIVDAGDTLVAAATVNVSTGGGINSGGTGLREDGGAALREDGGAELRE